MRKFFPRFLLALCAVLAMAGTAFAADGYEIANVDLNQAAGSVTVSLTVKGECSLFAALYDRTGRMKAADSAEMVGGDLEQVVPFSFDAIGEEDYVSVFVADRDNAPLCGKVSVYDGNVYAVLYPEGYDEATLVFQHGDETDPDALGVFPVNMAVGYSYAYDDGPDVPWLYRNGDGSELYADMISRVVFEDTIRPASTAYWFYGCHRLEEIEGLERLDTSGVTNMGAMFVRCGSLTELDLSGFDTGNVVTMDFLFGRCDRLERIYASDRFVTDRVKLGTLDALDSDPDPDEVGALFLRCYSLRGGRGTMYSDEIYPGGPLDDLAYARIDGGHPAPGFFTYKAA